MESNKRGTLVAAALLVAVLVCGGLGYRMLAARVEPEPAPIEQAEATDDAGEAPLLADHDATVYTVDGEAVTLTQIAAGRPLVINFWATWCTPCVAELPHFQQLWENYSGDVEVIALHSHLVTDDVQAYLDQQGYTMPFALDADGGVIEGLGGSTMLPMTVVLDRTGTIVYNQVGSVDYEALEQLVKPLL